MSPGRLQLSSSLPQKRVPCSRSRFSRIHDQREERFYQSCHRGETPRLGNPEKTDGSAGIHWFREFLPTFHSKFLSYRTPTNVPHTKRGTMAVGPGTTIRFRFTKKRVHHTPNLTPFRPHQRNHHRNGRQQFRNRCNHIPEMGLDSASGRVSLTQAIQT